MARGLRCSGSAIKKSIREQGKDLEPEYLTLEALYDP